MGTAKPTRCFSTLAGEAAQRLDLLWEHGEDVAVARLGAGTSASSCGAPGGHRGHRPQGAQHSPQSSSHFWHLAGVLNHFLCFCLFSPPNHFLDVSPRHPQPAGTCAHTALRGSPWGTQGSGHLGGRCPHLAVPPDSPGAPKQLLLGGTVLPSEDRSEDFLYSPPACPGLSRSRANQPERMKSAAAL